MDVFLANEQTISVDETRLAALARHALSSEDVEEEAELSILFVTPDHIRTLNARYAGDDFATDVLAFPMFEADEDGDVMLGDVVVCPQVAEDNARKLGHGVAEEIEMLLVHGTLHLLGYDHQTDDARARMDLRTKEILASFREGARS